MTNGSGFPRYQTNVYDKEIKPLLYGPKGEPLVRSKQVGFDPKRIERKDSDKLSR
jgi:hypothetical protein